MSPLSCIHTHMLGAEAVKAKNVFYYLTYIGSIDLDAVEDAGLRKVVSGVDEYSGTSE